METKEITTRTRKAVLAEYLKLKVETIEDVYRSGFIVNDQEWRVLTNEEAEQATEACIADSLWAFNCGFLVSYMPDMPGENEQWERTKKAILKMQGTLCEDANPIIRALIADRYEDFVEDAICADGRGHFLSGYDGEEVALKGGLFGYRI